MSQGDGNPFGDKPMDRAVREARRKQALRQKMPVRCPFCLEEIPRAEAREHFCFGMGDR